MKIRMDVKTLAQTEELAKAFAKVLNAPAIVLLKGDLGSGKTTFAKSLVKALGSSDEVTSPTFTILNVYDGKCPIYHFDMYRLSGADEALDLGFEEYFDKSQLDGIVLVEWPENVDGLISDVDFVVEIEKSGENLRKFTISVKEDNTKGEV